ncbi:methyl viologen resistance protein SmvA [Streptomyces sp. SPB074]|nr:methyl viologen resistance protein SmvA [Streptomyces sp. SPB074]
MSVSVPSVSSPASVPGTPGVAMSQQSAGEPRQLRLVLIAVCVALMAVIASVSGLNVAQPDVAVAFGASQSTILWIINIYTLELAALLLPLGALGDRLGRKPALLGGLLVFGLANIAAGFAPNVEVMFRARLLSGVGAAMIMPVTLAVITATFPAERRGKAIGVRTTVAVRSPRRSPWSDSFSSSRRGPRAAGATRSPSWRSPSGCSRRAASWPGNCGAGKARCSTYGSSGRAGSRAGP